MKNNILVKFKPHKILGKGSEGLILSTHNNKYTIKIYRISRFKDKMFINILSYLQNNKKLPKNIYKSYFCTYKKNNLNRYISNNNLPEYFGYKNNNNLVNLSKKYNMKIKLFEIMETYEMDLKYFLEIIKNKNIDIQIKINIITSLFLQGILSIYWLYMDKGIVHNDINYNNFLVKKTKKLKLSIEINNKIYKIDLYGYYLVIADFGFARTIELDNYKNYPQKIISLMLNELNPMDDIQLFIGLFRKRFLNNYSIHNIKINNSIFNIGDIRTSFKDMIKSYVKDDKDDIELNNKIYNFKSLFSKFMDERILSII